jgi:hemerythrin-like metal-binding protein
LATGWQEAERLQRGIVFFGKQDRFTQDLLKEAPMPLFIWKPSYETGIAEIDNDHRLLVGIINELYEAMKQGHGYEILTQTIDRLVDYANRHFEAEESFMRISRYPHQEAHVREHRLLQQKVEEMERERRASKGPSAAELLTFLCDWLRDHVTTVDKELGIYLKNIRG